ncbi:MAG TPA: N-acetyl-alpha-D-glucosaminyl L-malate synthase BshA, partial [Candidatus Acetothermia bacterium]|nr:N-acetyl-alpha-D-glucosaminyl L-malate synthase BshA [Candidatus Acetothermia bacterium]
EMKQLDVLHAHYAIPFGAASLLAKQILAPKDLKVVLTLHGTDITLVGNNASFRPVTRMTIERADGVSVVSRFLREETVRQFAIQRDLRVIYNFVDPERHDTGPCPCIPPCADRSQKTIIHISNFRPVKRIRDVMQIFRNVSASISCRLLLVGDGPDLSIAREMVEQSGLEDRVRFLGVVDHVAPLLARADLLLLPSATESFGLVALEAMASGVPVIASQVGGLPEVVEHGKTGYLAPVGDVDTMAQHALRLLTDPVHYDMVSTQAQRRARACFDFRQIVPQYVKLYEDVLTRREDR